MEDRCLLISDVDGTLLGDDEALAAWARWYDGRRHRVSLVYNSGRFVESVQESVAMTELPTPDAIIGGVGTEIHCHKSEARLDGWPLAGDGWKPSRIRALLGIYSELTLQPAEFLSDYKISYYALSATVELFDDMRKRLAAAGCECDLVFSSQRDLDVLPKGVNKGTAAAHLASHWGFSRDQVCVSGDTANDLAMFQHGFQGIVVGNALAELRRLDGSSVYHATQSHAAGVLEGVRHWLEQRTTAVQSSAG